MKRFFRLTAMAAAIVLPVASASADVVKVGFIADFTGAFAVWGSQFQQAIKAYQEVKGTKVKGPDGKEHEIQFVYRDATSAGPEKSKQLAEELVLREKVKFLAGFDLSPQAMAVADIATQAKTPSIIMNAATASITRGSPYFVRVSMTIPQHTAALGRWTAKNGIKTVYTIVSDYAPGYDAETYFNKEFTAGGGKVVASERVPQQETNYAAYMEKVLRAKPDALYMFLPAGAPSIAFVKAYIERGLKAAGIKLLGTGEMQQIFLPQFNDDVLGVVTAFHYTETNTNPSNIALRAQLKKMFGADADADIASVAAWDGTDLIYQAVAALGPSADGLKYVDFMKGKKLTDSPRGPAMIDPDERDMIQNIYIREVQKRDGKLVNIDIAQEDMVKDPWKLENPVKK
jgi:branched-chain amino acid transport system substrate-binding protein